MPQNLDRQTTEEIEHTKINFSNSSYFERSLQPEEAIRTEEELYTDPEYPEDEINPQTSFKIFTSTVDSKKPEGLDDILVNDEDIIFHIDFRTDNQKSLETR